MRRGGILKEMLILDLADEKASFCSKLLADLGARVIKVERPGGDPSRRMGPFWKGGARKESLSFLYQNTGKLGITLSLKSPNGKRTFLRLVEKADVVVETFPPGYLAGLGLRYEVLRKKRPGLILVSVTPFGQSGPRNRYKSCDLVVAAFGGQMHVTGGDVPLRPSGGQSHYTASLFAAVAILLAWRRRRRSGRGEHIDLSLQEAAASTLEHVLVRYFFEGVIAGRAGERRGDSLFSILPAQDGHILLTPLKDWETLVSLLDQDGAAGDLMDEKYSRPEYRLQSFDHILKLLGSWTKRHPAGRLFELGQLLRLPWAPVCSPRQVLKSPQLRARRFFKRIDHPELKKSLLYPGAPYKGIPTGPLRRAPRIGEHNDQVLLKFLAGREKAPGEKGPLGTPLQGKPLEGLRVLDFTWMLAGPYCTRILADCGAEVIKVQSGQTSRGAEANLSGYFNFWNRNKRSITLNMMHPRAGELALRLAARCDLVVENFSPRVMSNWGLEYDRLRAVQPDLIMVRLSAMGQTGPWRDFVSFGPTLEAFSGMTFLTSPDPDSPLRLGFPYADIIAGLYAALAALAALDDRERTGRGRCIDLSEYEAACTVLGPALLDTLLHGREVRPHGNPSEIIPAAPHGLFPCSGRDKWCVISVGRPAEWRGLCRALGHPAWSRERKFCTPLGRSRHAGEVNAYLGRWTAKRTSRRVVRLLQEAGVPAGAVQNAADLARDPQLRARNFFIPLDHPILGEMTLDRSALNFEEETVRGWRSAPLLGADNRSVFRDLIGLKEEEFSFYLQEGVIA